MNQILWIFCLYFIPLLSLVYFQCILSESTTVPERKKKGSRLASSRSSSSSFPSFHSSHKDYQHPPSDISSRFNQNRMIPTVSKYLNTKLLRDFFTFTRSNSLNSATGITTIGSSGPNPKDFYLDGSLSASHHDPSSSSTSSTASSSSSSSSLSGYEELFGVPRRLFPYYFAFLLDAIAIGLVMPLLPFSVMELGADAFQLSLVVSSNYVAQSIGCIVMGRISDMYGRKLVTIVCLFASMLSYIFLSHAKTLLGMAGARIISGSFGGLLPIMQSAVADIAPATERPKYLGRIMATFGLGFVIGPAISAILTSCTTRRKILIASVLPFVGLLTIIFFGQETKKSINHLKKRVSSNEMIAMPSESTKDHAPAAVSGTVPWEIGLLVLNGFALMYTFATETVYAMFIKDAFGYGEQTLSRLFAINGSLIGIFQIFLIKPLISILGKHTTLALGNLILSLGMIGVALVRHPQIHFTLFAVHIIGYSIADTSLASLITRYSSAQNQGSDLALNQAAQAVARVISPIVAGLLYEYSKKGEHIFPIGALPFIASSLLPATAVTIPLYLKFISLKRKDKAVEMRKSEEVQNLLDDKIELNGEERRE